MKILLCIVLLLVVLTLFAVWPGKRRTPCAPFSGPQLRTPRVLRQRINACRRTACLLLPRQSKTATQSWMYSLPRTGGWFFHDDTLDRMTPAKGFVHDMPWAEFRPSRWPAATSTRLCLPICCAPLPRPTPTRR